MKTLNFPKTVFICTLTLLFSNCFSITERPRKQVISDSTVCLVISGNVYTSETGTNDRIKVELIYYNTLVDSLDLKQSKKFKFALKKDAYYAIKISKPGYIPRIISICTKLKNELDMDVLYKFHFDTELLLSEESHALNHEALDFPIAIVNFDDNLNGFYYSEEYTSNIKRAIYHKQ